eukprot:CAMPEP_0203663288 /NCGR_PEP_ID=MMETSP0090-20130426/926_1 /ASSEMBLY_ACC=CAM_ASM_001088 /TAXON_ID=426623 /ORGANISM="Chaetoceros affinis, Strain CCMP159" /LENGTH=227 /DNA_ID=CAMNT_0050526175 /DNA_START=55 /DNA_END=738 /DNA_ORIENTATION=+
MGRYSSVQSYSDNNPNMRAVTHEAATASTSGGAPAALKTEKVYNPYGSTAGAGSGEFHIYRHARTREMERMQRLDDEEKEMNEQQAFDKKIDAWKDEAEEKLNKKRKKRMRNKASKSRKKNMNLSGVIQSSNAGGNGGNDVVVNEDEFEYTPLHELKKKDDDSDDNTKKDGETDIASSKKESSDPDNQTSAETKQSDNESKQVAKPPLPFKNDGSFLEMMKKMQEQK